MFNSVSERSPAQAPPGTYQVVYNLLHWEDRLYLPLTYIVKRNKQGELSYIQQQATTETVTGYGIELDAALQKRLEWVAALQPKALEAKFQPPKKRGKPTPLVNLFDQEDIRPVIQRYVHRRLHQLLEEIITHELPLSWLVERKVYIHDFLLQTSMEPWRPQLHFKQTESGIDYRLRLNDGTTTFAPLGRALIPVTNEPGWVVIDEVLRPLYQLNGNALKPFVNKEVVQIPQRSVKVYFQKFILRVAKKLDIQSEGFAVIQNQQLQHCLLKPIWDVLHARWGLRVSMDYGSTEFDWRAKETERTGLHFDTDDSIHVVKTKRAAKAEAKCMNILHELGWQTDGQSYLLPEEQDETDLLAPLHLLGQQRQQLLAAGFLLESPTYEDRQLSLLPVQLKLEQDQSGTHIRLWGRFSAGDHTFTFSELAPMLQVGERLFPLGENEAVVIPQAWINTYQPLLQLARVSGTGVELDRSQYTLLEGIGLSTAVAEKKDVTYTPSPLLKATLRPYQLDGVRWLVQHYEQGLGVCLADDMGLGKTLQTIALLVHAKAQKTANEATPTAAGQLDLFSAAGDQEILKPLSALVILPASLVFNWAEELQRFAPHLTVYRHVGPKRHKDPRLLARYDVLLTTYQTALRDVELLGKLAHELIILDESQQIKNKDSKIFKAINQLDAHHRVSLSGTPIENSLSDLWSQMQFINPGMLGSYRFFQQEYKRPIEQRDDPEKKAFLRKRVAPFLLRRTKTEVTPDLPELSTQILYTSLSPEQEKLYAIAQREAREELLTAFDAEAPQFRIKLIATLTRLRQLANHPRLALADYDKGSGKFTEVFHRWQELQKGGHKVLFFSSFVQHLRLYEQAMMAEKQATAWLSGENSAKQREAAVKRFKEDSAVQAFLISIKAGGTGLNLTEAGYVFILDPWWNPTTEQQAIARAHRIGQDKPVHAIKFISRGTIEERILQLQAKKEQLAEDIIGQSGNLLVSKEELRFLLG